MPPSLWLNIHEAAVRLLLYEKLNLQDLGPPVCSMYGQKGLCPSKI